MDGPVSLVRIRFFTLDRLVKILVPPLLGLFINTSKSSYFDEFHVRHLTVAVQSVQSNNLSTLEVEEGFRYLSLRDSHLGFLNKNFHGVH